MTGCRKCAGPLPPGGGPGRPAAYCGPGCRRAAEYELRRLSRSIAAAESRVLWHRRQVDGVADRGDLKHARAELAWWTAERDRLEGRLRLLLDDPAGEAA